MTQQINISILVPTYNRGHFIAQSLDSVLPQLRANDEVMVVDDGSEDNTGEILQAYGSASGLRPVFKAHSNAPDTRNRAIEEAKNPWLLWLDSDDILMPGILDHYRGLAARFPDVDVLYGNLELFGEIDNYHVDKMVFPNYYKKNKTLLNHLFFRNRIPNPGVMVKKVVYKNYGNYNTEFLRLHDYEFWIRTAPHINVKHCGKTVCKWRWHDGNMSSGSVNREIKYDAMIIDQMLRLYSLPELFPFYTRRPEKNALAGSYIEIGRQYRKVSDYSKAVDYLLKSIRIKPLSAAYIEILMLSVNSSHLLPLEVKKKIPEHLLNKAKTSLRHTTGKSYLEKYGNASLEKKLANLDRARLKFTKLATILKGTKKYSRLLAGSYFHLGEMAVSEKKYLPAQTMFEKCVQLQPGHIKASQYLQDICNK